MLLVLVQQVVYFDVIDNGLLIFSYYDICDQVVVKGDVDIYVVSMQNFVVYLDWFGVYGYYLVLLLQVIDVLQGWVMLLFKFVLLIFDDGLCSVYDKVFLLLQVYCYLVLVVVIIDYVDMVLGCIIDYGYCLFGCDDFVIWVQLKQMYDSGLIEVVSYIDDLYYGVLVNLQGNLMFVVVICIYSLVMYRYEIEMQYEQCLCVDFLCSVQCIEQYLGVCLCVIVWLYVVYNQLSNDIVEQLGMLVFFDLEGCSMLVVSDLYGLVCFLVSDNLIVEGLVYELCCDVVFDGICVLQIDLDDVYDVDLVQQVCNFDVLVEWVKCIVLMYVYLQVFVDFDGNNIVDVLYFLNWYMLMCVDLFSCVVWQLKFCVGVKVYVWLLVFGFELFDLVQCKVLVICNGDFDGMYWLDFIILKVCQIMFDIYEDLVVNFYFEGLLFYDDGYLCDIELLVLVVGGDGSVCIWVLIDFILVLCNSVQCWWLKLVMVCNLYVELVLWLQSEVWFVQCLDLFNKVYDQIVLMVMLWMEGSKYFECWLDQLLVVVCVYDLQLQYILFELQIVDWCNG